MRGEIRTKSSSRLGVEEALINEGKMVITTRETRLLKRIEEVEQISRSLE